jgi:hypothetical protein
VTVGVDQILTTTSIVSTPNGPIISATVTNYTGVLPVVPTDQVQIVVPRGLGFGSGTPNRAIVIFTGINDANSVSPNPGAHLLNTFWILKSSGLPNTWNLRSLSVRGYNIGDDVQIRNFMSAFQTVPVIATVSLVNVVVPENTIEFTETNYGEVVIMTPLRACGLQNTRRPCGMCSSGGGSSCGGVRCGRHRINFSLNHPASKDEEDQEESKARRYFKAGVDSRLHGFKLNKKKKLVRAPIGCSVVLSKSLHGDFVQNEEDKTDFPEAYQTKAEMLEQRVAAQKMQVVRWAAPVSNVVPVVVLPPPKKLNPKVGSIAPGSTVAVALPVVVPQARPARQPRERRQGRSARLAQVAPVATISAATQVEVPFTKATTSTATPALESSVTPGSRFLVTVDNVTPQ